MKVKDRKDQIDLVIAQAEQLIATPEAGRAWSRLCTELNHMTNPEAGMPRFKRLLRAVWVAATNEQS